MAEITPQLSASNWYSDFVYPIFRITSRATFCTSTYPFVFTSPLSTVSPVVTRVSQATFESGS